MPGVKAAAAASDFPGQGRDRDDVYTVREHPPLPKGAVLDAVTLFVDPGYFQAMQIPLLAGRSFTAEERLDRANKVIISQQLAREVFKGEDPIGKHLARIDILRLHRLRSRSLASRLIRANCPQPIRIQLFISRCFRARRTPSSSPFGLWVTRR